MNVPCGTSLKQFQAQPSTNAWRSCLGHKYLFPSALGITLAPQAADRGWKLQQASPAEQNALSLVSRFPLVTSMCARAQSRQFCCWFCSKAPTLLRFNRPGILRLLARQCTLGLLTSNAATLTHYLFLGLAIYPSLLRLPSVLSLRATANNPLTFIGNLS